MTARPDQDDHSQAKRQQIIAGAEIVFTECGYEGASMSRIALQATVSKGTLYNYFVGKSELFAAFVAQRACDKLSRIFEPLSETGEIAAILHQVADRMLTMMLSPSSIVLYRIVISEAVKFPHLAEIYWESGPQRGLAFLGDWLGQQMEAGRLRRADPHVAAGQFLALCHVPSCNRRRLHLDADLSPAARTEIAEAAARLFLAYYALPTEA